MKKYIMEPAIIASGNLQQARINKTQAGTGNCKTNTVVIAGHNNI
jgi:hypothetical protein